MEITLKNIKRSKFACHETVCFEASLYIDGKKAAIVSNDGNGGSNYYYFEDKKLAKAFDVYCKNLPPVTFKSNGKEYTLENDSDLVVSELLEKAELLKNQKKICKNNTVFKLKKDVEGAYRIIKVPFSAKIKESILNMHKDKIEYFLNERI